MTSTPMTTRADAPALAAEEYAALLATARTLEPGAWSAPTDCAGWTVRDIVAHVTGAAEEAARLPVLLRHYLRALVRERQREVVDSVNDQQLADRAGHAPAQLIEELERLAPLAVRGRQRVPALLRRVRMPAAAGALPGDTLGYLLDVIVTDNLFGDIITDIAAAIAGGIGLAASGNINPARTTPSMFEPVHGSAPDIAGQGKADPTAAILSAGMLLAHLGHDTEAARIEAAVAADLAERGDAVRATTQIGDAIAARL
jgi:hypothetical protein